MIPGGDPYGWGVFSVPMPHEVGAADPAGMPLLRLLTRDIPWRNVLFSVVMTCLVFASLLFLDHRQPTALVRPEPPPVEVTVMLREEPRVLPPAVVTAPAPDRPLPPPPPEPKVVRPTPPPPEPKVVRPTPPPPAPPVVRQPPPKPRPLRPPPPVEAPLPQPAPLARLPERSAKPLSALPQRQAEMVVQPEAALPAAPSLTPYQQKARSASMAELPQQATAFRAETAVKDLTVQPAPGRVAERAPTRAALPKSSAAFSSPAKSELVAVDTGLSQTRYATPSAKSAMPVSARSQTVATSRGDEAAVAAPQASGVRTDLGERVADAPAPAAGPAPVAFAGSGAEERLSGPAATVIPKGTAAASALPAGGSFDFLDLVAPSELDRSVLVSLNRLSTCRDPEAETKLKTRLAALLSQPARCRAGGVIFAIRNPESAYSIHIDLYNYEQREFQDRCEALRLAVQACEARR